MKIYCVNDDPVIDLLCQKQGCRDDIIVLEEGQYYQLVFIEKDYFIKEYEEDLYLYGKNNLLFNTIVVSKIDRQTIKTAIERYIKEKRLKNFCKSVIVSDRILLSNYCKRKIVIDTDILYVEISKLKEY